MIEKEEAFVKTINSNRALISKVASTYSDSIQDKEDLIQEIILQAWKSRLTFRNDAKVTTWLYKIAINVGMRHRVIRERRFSTLPLSLAVTTHSVSQIETTDNLKYIKSLIDQCHDVDRAILLLFLDGVKHQEIASIMGYLKLM